MRMILAILLMFWNVENFFDWKADGVSDSELQFSAQGTKRWTKKRFYEKCNAVAKTVLLAGDSFGAPPDFIGLAEVENRFVLMQLTSSTALRKYDYGIVHYDSPDRRGIDCALLYRRSRWNCIYSKPCHLYDSTGAVMRTRDILLAVLAPLAPGRTVPSDVKPGSDRDTLLAILVNHHPSKVGGNSSARRDIAMSRLLFLRDSLLSEGISRIIAVGDFNDAVIPAPGVKEDRAGTIKFQGRWEKIDGCPVLEGMSAEETVFDSAHLSVPDKSYAGQKPRRTYSGPRFIGGVSDHYPVIYSLVPLSGHE